jgi:hypothetical protein
MSKGVSLHDYEVGYTGNLSSKQQNESMDQIKEDLIEAYRRENKIQEQFDEYRMAVELADTVQDSLLNELNTNAQLAASSYAIFASGVAAAISSALMTDDWYPDRIWHNDFFTEDNVILNTYKTAEIDKEYGQLIIPAKSGRIWTHLPQSVDDDGNTIANPYVKVYSGSSEEDDREDSTYNMVGENTRIFIESRDSAFNKEVLIETPQGGRPLINHIAVMPFPQRFIDVLKLQYHTGNGWNDVPGFGPQYDAQNLSYHFDAVNYGGRQLRMVLGSDTAMGKNWVGVKQIYADYRDYEEEARIYLKYDADTPGVTHISEIQMDYTVQPASATVNFSKNPVDIRIVSEYQVDDSSDENLVNSIRSATAVFSTEAGQTLFSRTDTPLDVTDSGAAQNSVYVELILRKVNETTPILNYLTIYNRYQL